MAKRPTTSDLTSLQNQPSAVATINSNNANIKTAFDNTISRDGSSPNAMEADFDMNGHRILNLGTPASDAEAVTRGYLRDYLSSLQTWQALISGSPSTATRALDMGGFKITNLGAPTVNTDASTKEYVDDAIAAIVITPPSIPTDVSTKTVQVTGSTTARTLDARFGEEINVKDYGAVGDGTTDDTSAINAAITVFNSNGGTLRFPKGSYKVSTLTTITCSNAQIIGAGGESTMIKTTATTGNVLTLSGCQNFNIKEIGFRPFFIRTANYEIALSGTFKVTLEGIRIDYAFNGISVTNCTETRINRTVLRYMLGTVGVYMTGTVGNGSYRLVIDDIIADNPMPQSEPSIAQANKSHATSTAFSLGDCVVGGSYMWQCVQAGTTGGSAPTWALSGSSAPAPTNGGGDITDGTVKWRFAHHTSLAWIQMDNYAYTLTIDKAALLHGSRAFFMFDTANTGTSYPKFMQAFDLECDHNFDGGMLFNSGTGIYITASWFGSCLKGNGITLASTCKGDFAISNSRIAGCAQHGFINQGAPDVIINGCIVTSNSALTNNTYTGITLSNMVGGVVANCLLGFTTVLGVNQQSYGLAVIGTSDKVRWNDIVARGNQTGNVQNTASGINSAGTVIP